MWTGGLKGLDWHCMELQVKGCAVDQGQRSFDYQLFTCISILNVHFTTKVMVNNLEEIQTVIKSHSWIKSRYQINTNHLELWNNFLCEHSRLALKRSAFIEESEGVKVLKRLEISAISLSWVQQVQGISCIGLFVITDKRVFYQFKFNYFIWKFLLFHKIKF